jgi:hypothetical protein
LFAASVGPGSTGAGLSRSDDGGATFRPFDAGGITPGATISNVMMLPDGLILATLTTADAARDFGVRCSADLGLTWSAGC